MSALDQPWNIGAALARGAALHPDREAIVAADVRLSYDKLWQIAQAFALKMQDHGIGHGKTVVLESRDMIAAVSVMAATALLGARFVLHNPQTGTEPGPLIVLYSPDRPAPQVAGAKVVQMTADWSPRHTPVGPETAGRFAGAENAEAPWWTIHTSGTTGRPKALILSQRIAFDRSVAAAGDFRGGETRFCSIFPCYTRPFFVRAMAALVNGATILDFLDPDILSREGANLFSGSPKLVQDWLTRWQPRPRFARLQVSGAPFNDAAAARMLATFDVVEDVYGAGETNKSFVNLRQLQDGQVRRIGKPQDSTVQVLRADGHPCAVGEVGEVRVRNSYLASGYRDAPEATARSFRDGWFHPGDLARWEPGGALTIVGRLGQIINLSGTKIDPAEVEEVLHEVAGVQQSAVFLDPMEQMPPRTMAFLMLEPGIDMVSTVDAVIAHCAQRLAGLKAPGYFFVVPEIPMTHDGVPRRSECARVAKDLPRGG